MTTHPRNDRLFARTSRNLKPARPRRRAVLPFMESLENRLVLANFMVTTLADVDSPGELTLRDAITQANQLNQASTITIPSSLYTNTQVFNPVTGTFDPPDDTIHLSGVELPTITSNISIVSEPPPPDLGLSGSGIFSFSISGEGKSRVFEVGSMGSLSLDNLVVENGTATEEGGGILNLGALTLDNVTVSNNAAPVGGGIFNAGSTLLIDSSTITQNTATGFGGGVATSGGSVTFDNDVISNNTVTGSDNTTLNTGSGDNDPGSSAAGGGLGIQGGSVSMIATTVNGDVAQGGAGGPGGAGTSYGSYAGLAPFGSGASGHAGGTGIAGGAGGNAKGGAIAFIAGSLTISGSTISNNTARGGLGGVGGVGGRGQDGQGAGVTVLGNGADGGMGGIGGMGGEGGAGGTGAGGGIFVELAAQLTMINTTVSGNEAIGGQGGLSGAGGDGGTGGMGGPAGSGESSGGGAGAGGGGGAGGNGGTTGAPGDGQGGGILFDSPTAFANIASVTIAYNDVSSGPAAVGFYHLVGKVYFFVAPNGVGGAGGLGGMDGEPSTSSANRGPAGQAGAFGTAQPSSGGGIGDVGSQSASTLDLDLFNTIVAANTQNSNTASDIAGTLTYPAVSGANLIGTGGAGGLVNGQSGNLVNVSNPGLYPLGSYGGPTQTIALLTSSPAVDAGDNALIPTDPSTGQPVTTDQRGFARISGNSVDIGAFELQQSYVVTTLDDVDNGTTDPGIGPGTSLREAIELADTKSTPETITFAPGLAGTITLTLGQLNITNSMAIDGPGANLLSISGNGASGVFGIDHAGPEVTIQGLSIINGRALLGGGIFNAANLVLESVVVSGNTATAEGGGIANAYGGTLRLINTTISGNLAIRGYQGGLGYENGGYGGGIVNYNSKLLAVNCTITGNTAQNRGGGIANTRFSDATLTNVTMAMNQGAGAGVDIWSPAPLTLTNSIIADPIDGNFTYQGENLVKGLTNTLGVLSSDPLLGPLQDNGGPTPTMALLPGSPAVSAGVTSLAVDANGNPLTTDQRGFPRINSGSVDLGAYEVQAIFLSPTSPANGSLGSAYSQTLTAVQPGYQPSWGSITYAVTPGTLPPGLSLSTGGVLSGTPTTPGTFTFTVIASDIAGFGGRVYSVTIPTDSTSVDVTASSAAAYYGQSETFTATVTDTSGSATPTSSDGTVTFYYGKTVLGSATLSGSPATATLSTSALALGSHTITASYSGDASFLASGSAGVPVSVSPDPTSIAVSFANATLFYGQTETLTALITTPEDGGTPSSSDGTVTFYDGNTVLGSATLSGSPATATLTPTALAVGSHMITASFSGDSEFIASSSGVEAASLQSVVPATGLNAPTGAAVDSAGDVFIADSGNNRVVEEKADGMETTVGSGLNYPFGVAVDSTGDVFIADTFNSRLVEVKADGTQTTVGTGLYGPTGVAVDSAGDVFIADYASNRVLEVKADGTETTVGSGLYFPVGVAVDGSGDVFIADTGNNRVVEVKADGTQTTVGSGLAAPEGVAVDASGDVFIDDFGNNRVVEVKADGTQTTVGTGLSSAQGVAVDGSGDVFIDDTSNNRVIKVTAGVPLTVVPAPTATSVSASSASLLYGQAETFRATVTTPLGAATPTSSDGAVTFYDGTTVLGTATLSGSPATATLTLAGLAAGSYTITAGYSGDSEFTSSESDAPSVVPATGLNEPEGVAVDASGDVFIADFGNGRVVEVQADGTQTPVGSGLLDPFGVAVDATGDVFISDASDTQVVEVMADGSQTMIGNGFFLPTGVAVDGTGDVFVADTGDNLAWEIKPDDTQTLVGSGLNSPEGVAVDSSGDIFIADTGNNRVVELKAGGIQTTVGSGLSAPTGVAVNASGDVFIADTGNNRVVEVTGDGTQTTVGSGLSDPQGVAVNSAGDLFIADTGNNRVVELEPAVDLTVSPVAPTLTVNPVNITYGTALANGGLSGTATWTVGGNPVTVPGTFTYTSAAGTVLGAGNGQSEAVTFTPSDSTDYSTAFATVSVNVAQAGTTTALSASMNNTVYGQAVTFTATVAASAPLVDTPTGSVTFFDGATLLGGASLSGGVASLTVTTLAPGSDPITAVYSGDPNFLATTSEPVSQNVTEDATTTTVVSAANPSVFGQSITFTATISPAAPGSGTPTGTVIFIDGSTVLGSPTLSGGVATLTTSSLAVSNHKVEVVYGGDGNFTGGLSSVLTQTVTKDAATASVASSANPSVFGQSLTFTATVAAAAPGSGTPTGTVTFKDGSSSLGTATLSGGSASFTTSSLAVATHSITVSYSGNGNFTSNSSAALSQVVNQAGTKTLLVSATDPSVYGEAVTLTASVSASAPGSGTPTGNVTFYDGSTSLGTASLSSGSASFTTKALPTGPDAIIAVYNGAAHFMTSTSAKVIESVNQAGTTSVVASVTNPSIFGESVTFTATVKSVSPGSGTPTGSITFLDGSNVLGTATLSAGKATFKTSALPTGSDTITVSYSGDGNFLTSTSGPLTQTVNQAATTSRVTSSANPSVFGETVTFTATVKAVSPGSGTPTGSVAFLDGSTTLGTGTLSGGTATFSTSTLAVAALSITVVYGGDTNFLTSTSGILTQTVKQAGTTSSVTSSANPSVSGQAVTFTATIVPVSPGSGTPTGNVTFDDGSTVLGTVALNNGTASFTTSSLAVGTHSIKAVYAGNTDFKASTSAVLKQVVNSSSDLVGAGTIAPSLVDQALSALSDETLTDALVSDLAGLQTSVTRPKEAAAAARA